MKNLKKIITISFLAFGLSLIAQEDNTRMDVIQNIAKSAIDACESGPKSITELDDSFKEKASLYSSYFKQKDYKSAIEFWRPLFFNAPKYSKNLHLRGAKMYKKFAKNAEGEVKESYIDTLLAIHEVRIACFGSTVKLEQSKTFDWYNKRKKGNEKYVYDMFNNIHKKYADGGSENDLPANVLVPWADITLRAYKTAKAIELEELLGIYETITSIVDANIAAGKDQGKYKGSMDAITAKYKKYDILTCETIVPLAEKRYNANPDDETTIIKTYNSLKAGGCTDLPLFTEVMGKLVVIKPSVGLYRVLAGRAKKAGDASLAVSYYEKAIELETDDSEKIKLYYTIARMKISSRNLSSAREYARKMLKIDPNSGSAYMIIASTYAASGKICGTGNDFKSHTVSWAAIDTWRKAKSVDSSVAEEAQKMINKYSQYMPSKEELFYEGLSVGASYTISCLGVTTIIRASN